MDEHIFFRKCVKLSAILRFYSYNNVLTFVVRVGKAKLLNQELSLSNQEHIDELIRLYLGRYKSQRYGSNMIDAKSAARKRMFISVKKTLQLSLLS